MGQRILIRGGIRGRAGERGFTLVEVMTAMVIGIIALTANLAMFNYANRDFAYSRTLTNATNLATQKITDFKTVAFGTLLNGDFSDTVVFPPPPAERGITYTRSWNISDVVVDNGGTPESVGNIKKIRLTVRWNVLSRDHQITMSALTMARQ